VCEGFAGGVEGGGGLDAPADWVDGVRLGKGGKGGKGGEDGEWAQV